MFDDMVESGLLELSENGLRIEQVLGCTLLQDVEALTPITHEVLDKVNSVESEDKNSLFEEKKYKETAGRTDDSGIAVRAGGSGMIHIEIGKAEKLEGLRLDIPIFGGCGEKADTMLDKSAVIGQTVSSDLHMARETAEEVFSKQKKVIRTLIKKHIKITDVELGTETAIRNGKITINKNITEKAVMEDPLCKSIELSVIHPEERHIYTETIMDVCPIAVSYTHLRAHET